MDLFVFADALFKEYVLFRGFMGTFSQFNVESSTATLTTLNPDRLVTCLFDDFIAGQKLDSLWATMTTLSDQVYSRMSAEYEGPARRVEMILLQAYLVEAAKQQKHSNIRRFFEQHADMLLSSPDAKAWQLWFALPYFRRPADEGPFQGFFKREWMQLARQTAYNFFAAVLPSAPLPAVLQLQADQQRLQDAEAELTTLRLRNSELAAHLQNMESMQRDEADVDGKAQEAGAGAPAPKREGAVDVGVQCSLGVAREGASECMAGDGEDGQEGVELADIRSPPSV